MLSNNVFKFTGKYVGERPSSVEQVDRELDVAILRYADFHAGVVAEHLQDALDMVKLDVDQDEDVMATYSSCVELIRALMWKKCGAYIEHPLHNASLKIYSGQKDGDISSLAFQIGGVEVDDSDADT